jgi:hypothetical protein
LSTFAWIYGAIALAIGVLFGWRNLRGQQFDAEFFFLCVGIAVLWPLAIVLDFCQWWEMRQ